jgi:SAM-dependent methyltransferase
MDSPLQNAVVNHVPSMARIGFSRYAAALAKAWRLIRTGKIHLLASVPLYRCWWRLRGLDFGVVPVEKLGLAAGRSEQHKDGGGPMLRDLVNRLPITEDDAALDIGSGKGGAMATLARFPFRHVDGVEICPELVEIARRNLAKLKLSQCRVTAADATTFTDLDRYTFIFMYNPFPECVLKDVVANIAQSVARAPRRLRLIYSNPLCESAILASGEFRRTHVYEPYPDYRICVYETSGNLA